MSERDLLGLLISDLDADIAKLPAGPDSKFVIGFSGGLDSTVLLNLCIRYMSPSHCLAVHVNHGLSPNAAEWEMHCAEVTSELGVSFAVASLDVGDGNTELRARKQRLKVFEQWMQDRDIVVTAHHADDFSETVLWQFLTGRAHIGIPKCRPFGRGWLLRPLLGFTKEDLKEIAEAKRWRWIEDESNQDQSFDRNWIRHGLTPALRSKFPGLERNLRRFPDVFLTGYEYQPLDLTRGRISPVQIKSWLHRAGLFPTDKSIVEIASQQLARDDAQVNVNLYNGLSIRRFRGQFHIVRKSATPEARTLSIGTDMSGDFGCLTWHRGPGLVEDTPLRLGQRIGGETIRYRRQKKKVKSLMQAARIPPWQRSTWPILYSGNEIACVPNVAIADQFWTPDKCGWLPSWKPRNFGDDFSR